MSLPAAALCRVSASAAPRAVIDAESVTAYVYLLAMSERKQLYPIWMLLM